MAEELLETERSYVDNLEFLVREYKLNKAFSGIEGGVGKLFINIEEVLRVNQEFMRNLQRTMTYWDDSATRIGPMVSKLADQGSKIYATYASAHGNASVRSVELS